MILLHDHQKDILQVINMRLLIGIPHATIGIAKEPNIKTTEEMAKN
jgi:hypothetical protein